MNNVYKKDFKNLNCKIDKSISNLLAQFVEQTRMTKTAAVENALQMYIEHYNETGKIKD